LTKPFNGIINVDIRDSVPDREPYEALKPPEGAPNVLMIVWDDTGMAAEGRMKTQPGKFGLRGTGLRVGRDSGAGVSDEYEPPFRFTGGIINAVTINVSGEPYTDLEKEAQAMFSRQ
jgi:arylsulfatase